MSENFEIYEGCKLPTVALRGLVMFPEMILHFEVGRKKSIKALNAAMLENRAIFLVAQTNVEDDDPSEENIYKVGVICTIKQLIRAPKSDNLRVIVEGGKRALARSISCGGDYLISELIPHEDKFPHERDELYEKALMRYAREAFNSYSENASQLSPELSLNLIETDSPGHMADYIGFNIMMEYKDRQSILEIQNPISRLEHVCTLLTRETALLDVEAEIQEKVQEQMDKNQREYYLREQIKVISAELDEDDDPHAESEKYRQSVLALNLSEDTRERLLKDCERLSKMPSGSQDGAVLRNYLDYVLSLPWVKITKDKTDIQRARRVLAAEHYGLEKVKERVLEYISVRKLTDNAAGQILCLVGPPGVGKTSVASSVAKALGRKFVRVSLGGVRDESEIRGHRRTYIGAMPGRIIAAMKQAGALNPVILLDEVDKLGDDHRGDPSSALLEVLDGAQNHAFVDHYVDVPFDLSKVLFITTANDKYNIPAPLLDRMDVIELGSYTAAEKFMIAKKYLIPAQIKKNGITGNNLRITDDAIYDLISSYTREAGVRRLEQVIASVCRKSAVRVASDEKGRLTVTPDNIESLIGARKFKPEDASLKDEVGVANGLAWTQVGGETLEVEVAVMAGKGEIKLTGSLGDVMKESAMAAVTYIRSHCAELGIDCEFYKNYDIHIHFPEGAVPKDGPSAGVTVTTAIVSALSGIPVRGDVAMTGEVTLRGRVLAIGGLKEKTMAAYRKGVKTVIIPKANLSDLNEIDSEVRDALEFIAADSLDTVLANALRKECEKSYTDGAEIIPSAEKLTKSKRAPLAQ